MDEDNLTGVQVASVRRLRRRFPFYVMDFDHREGEEKTAHVAMLVNMLSINRLLNEIAKCDLVCANCHRVRTYKREQRFSGMV